MWITLLSLLCTYWYRYHTVICLCKRHFRPPCLQLDLYTLANVSVCNNHNKLVGELRYCDLRYYVFTNQLFCVIGYISCTYSDGYTVCSCRCVHKHVVPVAWTPFPQRFKTLNVVSVTHISIGSGLNQFHHFRTSVLICFIQNKIVTCKH